jgi:hypothetical protein
LEFSDYTGSVICILFDTVAQKLIGTFIGYVGKPANEVYGMSEEDIQDLF